MSKKRVREAHSSSADEEDTSQFVTKDMFESLQSVVKVTFTDMHNKLECQRLNIEKQADVQAQIVAALVVNSEASGNADAVKALSNIDLTLAVDTNLGESDKKPQTKKQKAKDELFRQLGEKVQQMKEKGADGVTAVAEDTDDASEVVVVSEGVSGSGAGGSTPGQKSGGANTTAKRGGRVVPEQKSEGVVSDRKSRSQKKPASGVTATSLVSSPTTTATSEQNSGQKKSLLLGKQKADKAGADKAGADKAAEKIFEPGSLIVDRNCPVDGDINGKKVFRLLQPDVKRAKGVVVLYEVEDAYTFNDGVMSRVMNATLTDASATTQDEVRNYPDELESVMCRFITAVITEETKALIPLRPIYIEREVPNVEDVSDASELVNMMPDPLRSAFFVATNEFDVFSDFDEEVLIIAMKAAAVVGAKLLKELRNGLPPFAE